MKGVDQEIESPVKQRAGKVSSCQKKNSEVTNRKACKLTGEIGQGKRGT